MFNEKILEPHKHTDHKSHVKGKGKSRKKKITRNIINSGAGNTSSEEKDKQKVKIRPLLL